MTSLYLDGGAAEYADGGACPWDALVEVVEPPPRRLPGHEPRHVHHLAAAAQVRHLPPQRLLRLPLRSSLPAGLGVWDRVLAGGGEAEPRPRGHHLANGEGEGCVSRRRIQTIRKQYKKTDTAVDESAKIKVRIPLSRACSL